MESQVWSRAPGIGLRLRDVGMSCGFLVSLNLSWWSPKERLACHFLLLLLAVHPSFWPTSETALGFGSRVYRAEHVYMEKLSPCLDRRGIQQSPKFSTEKRSREWESDAFGSPCLMKWDTIKEH